MAYDIIKSDRIHSSTERHEVLALDVGNTNIVMGVLVEDPSTTARILKSWRMRSQPLPTSDELLSQIDLFLTKSDFHFQDFKAILVSSVVPALSEIIRKAFSEFGERGGIPLHFIDSSSPFSFEIAAYPKEQVGADRLVNAEAVVREYGAPAIIVDSGTATTLCAVSVDRQGGIFYQGGAIMPGLELSIEMLATRAAKLYAVALEAPAQAIGGNTTTALQSGILLGYASMIDGMIERFIEELRAKDPSQRIRIIGTGGVSQRLAKLTKRIEVFDTDLTLKGIYGVYQSLRQTTS